MAYVHRLESPSWLRLDIRALDVRRVLPFGRPNRIAADKTLSPFALRQVVEQEIIPRLVGAHMPPAQAADRTGGVFSEAEISRFTDRLMIDDLDVLAAHVDTVLRSGVDADVVNRNLLMPAADRLAALWDDDRCSSTDRTIGLCRLYQLASSLADGSVDEARPSAPRAASRVTGSASLDEAGPGR